MLSPYNIDALRTKDGYRFAPITFIQGAIECGHTAHIQTEHGTVAFRPYNITKVRVNKRTGEQWIPGEQVGQNWLVEYYPQGHATGDEIRLYTASAVEAAQFAYGHLNGMDYLHNEAIQQDRYLFPTYSPNDSIDIYSNQAMREGVVLAAINDRIICEYEMPGTTSTVPTSALVEFTVSGRNLTRRRSHSYNNVPAYWLKAIRRAEMQDWIGMGQRSHTRIPFPKIADWDA